MRYYGEVCHRIGYYGYRGDEYGYIYIEEVNMKAFSYKLQL